MLEGIISLASSGFFRGGSVGNMFAQWEAMGVFSYVLPFLLLFALIFVILSKVPLFKENKGVNAVIALAVALMSLQFNFVSLFFAEIFPTFGIALAIILVVVIVLGFFLDPDKKQFNWIYVVIGIVITAVVVFSSLGSFGYYGGSMGWFWSAYWGEAIGVAIFVALFIWIISSTKPTKGFNVPEVQPFFMRTEKE